MLTAAIRRSSHVGRRRWRCSRASASAALAGVLLYAPITPAAPLDSRVPTASLATAVALRQALEHPDGPRVDGESRDVNALKRFYRQRDFAPVWGADDVGIERAALLVEVLARADAHGLSPRDYHLDAIRDRGIETRDDTAIGRELLLTDAYFRYATHVRAGRLRPEQTDQDWGIATPRFDPVSSLTEALREQSSFSAVLASLPRPRMATCDSCARWDAIGRSARGP